MGEGGTMLDELKARIEELDAVERESIYNLGAVWGRREELRELISKLAEKKIVDIAGAKAETAARDSKPEKR
jgi:hypothetical protein